MDEYSGFWVDGKGSGLGTWRGTSVPIGFGALGNGKGGREFNNYYNLGTGYSDPVTDYREDL